MDLTARDIHDKQFHDAWRGYDQEEVDDFLDRVAETTDALRRENEALRARVADLEGAVAASRSTEEMLKKTLVTAQSAAEEAIAKAKARAEQLIAEAEERARRADEEAQKRTSAFEAEMRRRALEAERAHTVRKRELDNGIERLRSYESEVKERLKAFLDQQQRALESLTSAPDAPRGAAPPSRPARAAAGPAGRTIDAGRAAQETSAAVRGPREGG
jgi:cell division initiation protein